jgi:hypothetical protein
MGTISCFGFGLMIELQSERAGTGENRFSLWKPGSFGKGREQQPICLGCRLSYNRTWRVVSIHSRSANPADWRNFTHYWALVKNSFCINRSFSEFITCPPSVRTRRASAGA